MKCILCQKDIKDYIQEFNQLDLNESKSVDVCYDCIQKFNKWQQELFAKLYLTSFAKKWLKKTKNQ